MHFKDLQSINPGHGPVWHGCWRAGHIEPNRRIYDFELVWFSAGTGRVITERGTWFCVPGSAVVIPPGLTHCTISDTPVERWCIHFDWFGDCRGHLEAPQIWVYADSPDPFREELCARPPEADGLDFPYFRRALPERFRALLLHHFRLYPENDSAFLERKGVLLEILGEVLRPETEKKMETSSSKTLFRIKNRIDASYSDPRLSIGELAAEACVTRNHLTKLFKRELGMSVLDYIHMRRLEHAERLLAETAMTVRETAFAVGFNDPNYFIRLFRKRTGRTPGARRKIIRAD